MQDTLNIYPLSTVDDIPQCDNYSIITAPTEVTESLPFDNTPLRDTGTMGLVMIVFFFLAISYRKGYKYVSNFSHNMFSVRKRQNAFEDHTMSETQVMIALIANTCLMMGLLLYIGVNEFFPSYKISEHVFAAVSYLSLLYGAYIVLQIILYYLLGYVFARYKEDTRLWLDGFKASQSILGLFLFPIVFIILLYPGSTYFMLILSAFLYFCARLVFVCKGFRIFFNNLSSSLYFILYLCTVEIVPVFLMCAGTISLIEIL